MARVPAQRRFMPGAWSRPTAPPVTVDDRPFVGARLAWLTVREVARIAGLSADAVSCLASAASPADDVMELPADPGLALVAFSAVRAAVEGSLKRLGTEPGLAGRSWARFPGTGLTGWRLPPSPGRGRQAG